MKPLLIACLLAPSLAFAQISLDLTPHATTANVKLQGADPEPVQPLSVPVKLSYATYPLVGTKAVCKFEIPEKLPTLRPEKLLFGGINPDKGWGIRLARVEKSEGTGTFRLRLKVFSMAPEKESQPYPTEESLKFEFKGPSEGWILKLPKPLPPGIYVIAAANGSTAPPFSNLKVEAAAFEVPEATAPQGLATRQ